MDRPVSEAQTKTDLGETVLFKGAALKLDCGAALEDIEIAFRTYGQLNAEKTNAILICHALTMDQHAASENPLSGKPGWWIDLIGAGKIIDTDRYFVICSNVIGGWLRNDRDECVHDRDSDVCLCCGWIRLSWRLICCRRCRIGTCRGGHVAVVGELYGFFGRLHLPS